MGNKPTDRKGSRDIIRSRDRIRSRAGIMTIDGEEVMASLRRCWPVWRVVVVWMLVCCSRRSRDTVTGSRIEYHGDNARRIAARGSLEQEPSDGGSGKHQIPIHRMVVCIHTAWRSG